MSFDPVQRFLGVDMGAEPAELLGLPRDAQLSTLAIEEALRRRLGEIYNHPEGRSEDAESVRRALRDAAATLKRNTPSSTAQIGKAAHRASGVPMPSRLTAFDRSVLAILVGCGGWNAISRARLIGLAAAHGVTSHGLLKVITGLGQFARTGLRLGVGQIMNRTGAESIPSGVGASVLAAATAQSAAADTDQAATKAKAPRDLRRETLRLSLLYGLAAMVLAALAVTQIAPRPFPGLGRHAQRSVAPDQVALAPQPDERPVELADVVETDKPAAEPPIRWQPLRFSALPTFNERVPDEAARARDACAAAAEDLDQIARQLTVAGRTGQDSPGEMTLRTWDDVLVTVGRGWVLLDEAALRTIERGIMDVLFAAPRATRGEPAELHARLLRSLSPPPRDSLQDPLDVWRGAWNVGMLARIAFHPDLPPDPVDLARAKLNAAIGRRAGDDVRISFTQAAALWLNRAVPALVERLNDAPPKFVLWEMWLSGQKHLIPAGGAGRERFNGALIAAVEAILRRQHELIDAQGDPTPHLRVVGRLLEEADFSTSPRVHDGLLALLDETEHVRARDLWIITSVLSQSPRAGWFDENFILLTSDPNVRRRLRQDIESAWPASALAHRRDTRRSPIDPVSGERWLRLAQQIETEPVSLDREDVLLRQVIGAARMGEAAAYLVAQTPARGDRLMNEIETALSSAPPDAPRRRPLAQPKGTEGGWAAAYSQAGRDVEERLRLLRTLRSTAGEDLHPADAAALVREVYRGSPQEVRTEAQSVLVEVLARGPNVAREMLDQLPEAQRTSALSETLTRYTRHSLPSGPGRDLGWSVAARLALVEHLLSLLHEAGPLIEQLADELGGSYSNQAAALRGDDMGPTVEHRPGAVPPAIGSAELFAVWRERASGYAAGRLGEELAAFDRRHRARIALSDGPVQETIAMRIATLELLAISIRAVEPELDRHVLQIVQSAAAQRKDQPSALLQALTVERAIIALWRIRLNVPEDVELDRPDSEDVEDLARTGRSRGRRVMNDSSGAAQVVNWTFTKLLAINTMSSLRPIQDTGRWRERLEALTPSRPMEYFELAEEILDGSGSASSIALSRHLFALAGALDPSRLGRSACLAVASLEETPHVRTRMLVLADLLERGDDFAVRPVPYASDEESPERRSTALALCAAFSHYRQGQGSRALQLLQRDDVMKLLEAVESALPWRSAQAFLNECANLRGRRPSVSEANLVRMIQIEQYLLGGDRNWSMELAFSHGRPLIEIDPHRLDEALGVDANRPFYRAGRWLARP